MKVTACSARTLQQKQAFMELNDTGEDVEIVMANAEKALKQIGVSIRDDMSGDLRGLEEILGDVADKWQYLDDSTKQFVGEKLAGNNRRSYFESLMENYQRVKDLQDEGLNSFGELAEANQKRVESFEGQLNILKDKMLAFTDGLQPLIFGSVELGNNLLDLVNGFGAIPTVVGLASASFLSFSDSGQKLKSTLMEMVGAKNEWVNGLNQIISAQNQKIEATKNELAIKQQEISSTIETIAKLRLEHSALNDNTDAIKRNQETLVGLNEGLIKTQKELAMTTLKATALQTVLSLGLGLAIGGAIALVSAFAKELKNATPSLETAQESVQSFSQSIDDYEASIQKAKQAKEDIASVKSIIKQLDNENLSFEKQNKLLDEANDLLASHGSNYTSIKSTLENENIPLEERVKLLEREAELEAEKTARDAYKKVSQADFFGNSLFDKLGNSLEDDMGDYATLVRQMNSQINSLFGSDELVQKKTEEISSKYNALLKESITDMESFVTQANEAYSSVMKAYDLGIISEEEFNKYKQQYEDLIKNLEDWATQNKVSINIATLTVEGESEEAIDEKAQLLKEKIAKTFNESYENPFSFDSVGDLDKTIDDYQKLYAENEKLIEILNEANAIELKDGLPISKGFSEILNSNLDDMDNFEGALLTINELFEDMSATDLTEMFGSDLASQIQEVLNIDMSTPFEDISGVAREAVEDVIGSFSDMEEQLKDVFYRLNSTNSDFYNELVEKNAQVFSDIESRWGVSANEYSNVAEYKRAVDQQVYSELMQMDANTLNQLYQNTLQLLGIKEEAGEERVSMEDQAAYLINQVDLSELKAKLKNEKKQLEAKKAELEGELKAEESASNNALKLQDDTNVKSLQMMNTMGQRATSHYNSFYGSLSRTGALEGTGITAMSGTATVNTSSTASGSVTAKALSSVNDKLAQIDGLLSTLESYEKLTSGDLTFNITPYNPSNSSTTNSGGYSPSKGSSSSGNKGSSSKDTQKEVADLELKIDRYYQLQDAIDDVNNALNENERAMEKAEGKQQLNKLYEDRVKLLEQQKKAYEDLLKEQRNEAQEYRNAIATAGFKLDSSGNVTNYKQQLESMVKYANSLSGDAKSAQIEYVNSIVDIIEAYTTLTNSTIPDTEESIDDVAQAIKDLNKEHEEAIKYLNDLKDAYYNLNKAIKEIDNALSLIDAKMETATPEERVKLMEEEIALMKERQDLIQEQQKAYEKEAKDLSKELSSQGIKFKADGTISNYDEVINNLINVANGLVGSAQEEAQEEIEELLDLIEEYDEIMLDTLPSLSEEWYEYANSIKEAEEAKAELVADIQKDLTSAIENEYNKRYNALKTALQKEKDLYNQQYEEEDHQNTLAKKNQELAELQKAIDDMARDTSDAGQAKLQDLLQQYKEKQEEINEYIRDYEKEQGNNRFDEEMEKLDEELEEILSAENIADMVNKALVDGFVTIEDEVIELSTLMSDWLNDTGDGLYAMGDILREELINNLKTAQELFAGMGIVPTSIGSSPVSLSSLVDTKALELGAGNKSVENNVTIGSLLSVEGNVTEEVLPKIEAMLSEFESNFEEVIIEKLADEMSKY